MSRLLYIDAVAGVAGDMLLAALLDAGARRGASATGLGRARRRRLVSQAAAPSATASAPPRIAVVAAREHAHRDWAAVRALIDAAGLPTRAHARAHEAFRRLAEAEGRVHGVAPDEVHFHEVGAIDAIADVCGVALALEALGIDERRLLAAPRAAAASSAPRTDGSRCRRRRRSSCCAGAPLYGVDLDVELVTPTGAALVAALATPSARCPR